MTNAASLERQAVPEARLYKAVFRRSWLCVAMVAMSTVAGLLWIKYVPRSYAVYAEILVRYAFEYTPLDVGRAGDTMQVRIDADTALNSDVQILTSRPLIGAAVGATRSVLSDPEPTTEELVETASRALAVSRIPGTSVIKIVVTHPDRDWAKAFLEDLLTRYQAERLKLFSADETRLFFTAKRTQITKDLRALDEQFYEASTQRRGADSRDPLEAIASSQEISRKRQMMMQSLERVDALLERLDLQSALNQKLSFVTPPTIPTRPVGFPSFVKLALFVFAGLAAGVTMSLLLEGARTGKKGFS